MKSNPYCTTIYGDPIFSTRYSVMCKVYLGYCGTSEIEHGLCACTVDNPLAKARGLSFRTGAQTMLYLTCLPRRRLTFKAQSLCSGLGCSKLTTSLVNETLKFQTLISQICQYFLLKKCEKLLQCKSFSHFYNQKYQCIW